MRRTRYSRREFVTPATALAAVAGVSEAAARKRPNILWLVSEDNNPFIGAYGDRVAHTPAIDSLAAGGVLYENVFSNAPVCAPTRFAIIAADKGDGVARDRARQALERLSQGEEAISVGDPFPDLSHFAAYEPEQVYRLFGRSELAAAAFFVAPGRWMGPYRSGYGWHLIRVETRQESRQPDFFEIRER